MRESASFDVFRRVKAMSRVRAFVEADKSAVGAADPFRQIYTGLVGGARIFHRQLRKRVVDVEFRRLIAG